MRIDLKQLAIELNDLDGIVAKSTDPYAINIQVTFKANCQATSIYNFSAKQRMPNGLAISATLDDEVRVIRKPVAEIGLCLVTKILCEIARAIETASFGLERTVKAWPEQSFAFAAMQTDRKKAASSK